MKRTAVYKWEVLALLWIAYLLNQADRQIFNVVLPLISDDLKITDFQAGMIATIFNIAFAICVPIAGFIGDRFNRKWIVALSLLFWSIATMFTGLSSGIIMLIVTRSLATGAGEAFFGPANYSLLASYHKEDTRSFAMSVHQTAYYIGIVLSSIVAAYIGEMYGWRNAFYIFGAIGVVHAFVTIYRLKENRSQTESVNSNIKFFDGFKMILRTPTAIVLTIGFSGVIFVLSGYLTWMPTYLYEGFNMSLTNAGFQSMFYTHLFAFIGIIVAGKWSDKIAKTKASKRMMMQGLGLLIAAPFILLMGKSSTLLLIYTGFAGFGFARAFFDANTYTVLYDVIPKAYHSSASGVMIMVGFLVGSTSSAILGYIKPTLGLSNGIAMLSVVWILCGLLFIVTAKYQFAKDYKKVHR